MDIKKLYSLGITILFIVAACTAILLFASGRRNNIKAAEVEKQLNISVQRISGLELTIEAQRQTHIDLIAQRDEDRKTISELRETSRKLGAFVAQQRNIIREITSGDNAIRKSSGTITIRLEDSIKEVEDLINFIKNRKD